MDLKIPIYLYICIFSYIAKINALTGIKLDIDQTESTDLVKVVREDHFGLPSIEYYPVDGVSFVSVVQGELPVWKAQKSEYSTEAILYFSNEALSLFYLEVRSGQDMLYKCFLKVMGQWREIAESAFETFLDIDRSAYTEQQLNEFAEEYLAYRVPHTRFVKYLIPTTFGFMLEPHYECTLELFNHNSALIMEQSMVGPVFGKIYTPRIDFAISKVSYKDQDLWAMDRHMRLCSSVWYYFKGDFDSLLVINLYNFNTGSYSHICFRKNKDSFVQIDFKKYQKLLMKMTFAEYDKKDLMCYHKGLLKMRDYAYVIKPMMAIVLISTAVLYNL